MLVSAFFSSFSVFTVIGAKAIPILVVMWLVIIDTKRSFEGSQNYLGKPQHPLHR